MEEQKGVNGAADQQTGEKIGAADQELNERELAFKAKAEDEVKKRQELENELADIKYQQQINQIVQANQQQPQRAETDPFAGRDEDDPMTVGEVKSMLQTFGTNLFQQVQQQTFLGQHSDFSEIVGNYQNVGGRQVFVPAEPLKQALKDNPALQFALANNPHAAVVAYDIAKKQKQIMDSAKQQQEAQAKVAASDEHANQQKIAQQIAPMSPAAAGGGGAISQAAQVGGMNNEQFAELDRKVMGGEYG